MLDIVPKLLRTGLGEIHAVISAQPARFSLEIRTVLDIAPLIINETVPDIDIRDTGFVGARAVKVRIDNSCRLSIWCRGPLVIPPK